jgi:CMP-N-acetylneuraminic acid synthetase
MNSIDAPKVTVYITSYNYANYVEQAIESVLTQNFEDYELLIFDDGSTDNTPEVLKRYEDHPKIKIFYQENSGLPKTCNNALRVSQGKYIMRLDADDYLDENALLVMSNVLDKNPNYGLVYPDYYHISKKGKVLDIIRRNKIGKEDKIMDLPAHGACTMTRKKCLEEIGGYDEETKCQDGYSLWMKFVQKFKPYNVNLPLFYYRMHNENLTCNSKKILTTRRYLKEKFVKQNLKNKPRVLAIIPTRGEIGIYPKLPLKNIAGKPLVSYVVQAALNSKNVNKVIITSEDEEILNYCKTLGSEIMFRPKELGEPNTPIEPTIDYVINKSRKEGFSPDIIIMLFVTSPLITSEHIEEAINTLLIYNADSVISVKEDNKFHYKHDQFGLKPLFDKRKLRLERESLFEETGSLFVSKIENINKNNFLGEKISHTVLNEDEANDIHTKFDFWVVEKILEEKKRKEKIKGLFDYK